MKTLIVVLGLFLVITQTSDRTYTYSDGNSSGVVVVN
jgi:hypothetical protein